MKYKYITIKPNGETFNKKPVYEIVNNKSQDQLGIICYYSPWRQYVFTTDSGYVFNKDCLKNVIDFIENHIK